MDDDEVALQVAIILTKLENEDRIRSVSNQALDMSIRASRGWWERSGSPFFNEQMAKIKKELGE